MIGPGLSDINNIVLTFLDKDRGNNLPNAILLFGLPVARIVIECKTFNPIIYL